jgi:hypothetical protein
MAKSAIEIIEDTADFYHSMFLEPDDQYWEYSFLASMDLLDRIQDLPEGTSLEKHHALCEHCEIGDSNG